MAVQTVDYSGLADTALGTALPNFDGGQATSTVWITGDNENRPYIQGGGWTLNPLTTGKRIAAYHQWNAGVRITKVLLKFRFTDSGLVAVNSGPVIAVYNAALVGTASGLQVPPGIACHAGVSQTAWHIDVPWPLGLIPVASGNFKAQLAWNVDYYFVLEYIAADTIKLTLPDGSVPPPIKHPNFNLADGNWAFSEVYLQGALQESKCKILKEQFDTTQWQGNTVITPPTPAGPGVYYEPYCRYERTYLAQAAAEADAITTAQQHVTANPGHVLDINKIVR